LGQHPFAFSKNLSHYQKFLAFIARSRPRELSLLSHKVKGATNKALVATTRRKKTTTKGLFSPTKVEEATNKGLFALTKVKAAGNKALFVPEKVKRAANKAFPARKKVKQPTHESLVPPSKAEEATNEALSGVPKPKPDMVPIIVKEGIEGLRGETCCEHEGCSS
jgi:hypothetical protein